jgi:hypothetical protein
MFPEFCCPSFLHKNVSYNSARIQSIILIILFQTPLHKACLGRKGRGVNLEVLEVLLHNQIKPSANQLNKVWD